MTLQSYSFLLVSCCPASFLFSVNCCLHTFCVQTGRCRRSPASIRSSGAAIRCYSTLLYVLSCVRCKVARYIWYSQIPPISRTERPPSNPSERYKADRSLYISFVSGKLSARVLVGRGDPLIALLLCLPTHFYRSHWEKGDLCRINVLSVHLVSPILPHRSRHLALNETNTMHC